MDTGPDDGRPAASFTLQTTLLGPLLIPAGADRAAAIEDLSRRAAFYATRARGDGTRRAYRAASAHGFPCCTADRRALEPRRAAPLRTRRAHARRSFRSTRARGAAGHSPLENRPVGQGGSRRGRRHHCRLRFVVPELIDALMTTKW
jgi:hypothetical protein